MGNGGLKNLQNAAARAVSDRVAEIYDEAIGDSPIEKLFFTALQAHVWQQASEYTQLRVVTSKEEEDFEKSRPSNIDVPTLILRPQVQLEGWRVDFLIHAYDFARKGGPQGWMKLIVECDGHDFHERTKEQAARDRSRDREVQLNEYSVLRFTGSEIYANAWECVSQVTYWAVKGFP